MDGNVSASGITNAVCFVKCVCGMGGRMGWVAVWVGVDELCEDMWRFFWVSKWKWNLKSLYHQNPIQNVNFWRENVE